MDKGVRYRFEAKEPLNDHEPPPSQNLGGSRDTAGSTNTTSEVKMSTTATAWHRSTGHPSGTSAGCWRNPLVIPHSGDFSLLARKGSDNG